MPTEAEYFSFIYSFILYFSCCVAGLPGGVRVREAGPWEGFGGEEKGDVLQ